jgi:hypothetical protein
VNISAFNETNIIRDDCVNLVFVGSVILDKSAHGLRKAAATRAADNGATAHELMAIFGWVDIKEAEIYTRAADRKRLAAKAMSKIEKRTDNGITGPGYDQKIAKTVMISGVFLRGGALGGTRTPTILLTATSRQRVYQFRHERLGYRLEPVGQRRIDGAM